MRIIAQEYFLAEKSGQSLNKTEMVSALPRSRDEIIFHTIVRWKKDTLPPNWENNRN